MTMDILEEAVRALLIEAATTERKLSSAGIRPQGYASTWPVMDPPAWSDVVQYGATRLAEMRAEFWERARAKASASEVSRMERICELVIVHVERDEDRRAVLAWARAKAGGKQMLAWCRAEGIHKNTGKRRADAAVSAIASRGGNEVRLLAGTADDGVVTGGPVSGIEFATLADCDRGEGPAPTAWMADDARPVAPDLSDPDQARATVESIEKHNERMRRGRERWEKRRAREEAA